jgi:predicted nucleic acid-binding protein
MEYLDTNILVRYLTKDDPEKSAKAYAFLQEVEQGVLPWRIG